ncbi:P-type DNA transfer protein VirB5 [Dickeya dadantii]|uniref:P-type DNA transfer protein VirB5 n=1 Tax=Dickeya dadantii TaxID=204038 RepID=UPI001495FE0E|nr:P-type DNA transfer protein VirB5 [Dickeya dadantii]NPE55592.1 P-type DNA transfer protein VirB5 [Dickeya dadantii]NPE68975.1 P-type DNA transfer protein VirB5 [Dickeya dadantii]
MKRIAFILAISVNSFNAGATGIPVFDGAAVANMLATIQQLKNQLTEMERLRSQMEGMRNMGSLLNKPELRNYLPSSWQGVYDSVKSGGYKGIDGAYGSLNAAESVLGTPAEMQALKQRRWDNVIANKAMGQAAYTAAMQRLDNIEALGRQINATTDQKSILELNGRITQEQALIQNENARLQLMSMLQQAEDKIAVEKERKINSQIWSMDKSMPRF